MLSMYVQASIHSNYKPLPSDSMLNWKSNWSQTLVYLSPWIDNVTLVYTLLLHMTIPLKSNWMILTVLQTGQDYKGSAQYRDVIAFWDYLANVLELCDFWCQRILCVEFVKWSHRLDFPANCWAPSGEVLIFVFVGVSGGSFVYYFFKLKRKKRNKPCKRIW